jgi:hypothetical protein
MALFTTALGLYDGVLRSGELQGFIIHERVPTGGLSVVAPTPTGFPSFRARTAGLGVRFGGWGSQIGTSLSTQQQTAATENGGPGVPAN